MILVTGGCGFIGSAFILQWLASTQEPVVNLDLLTYAGHPGNLSAIEADARYHFYLGDIGDADLTDRLLAQHRLRAILNFVAESQVDRSISGPLAFAQTNVVGTLKLVDTALAYWKRLEPAQASAFRSLHVSTDEVCGSLGPDAAAFTEEHRYEPNSPNSASNLFVRAYHHTYGLPITRCSANRFSCTATVCRSATGCTWTTIAAPSAPCCSAAGRRRPTTRASRRWPAPPPGCCAPSGHRRDALRPMAGDQRHADLVRHVKDRPGHDRRYAIDDGKIASELGRQPSVVLEEGIRQTVQWYLSHEEWVASVTSRAYRQWVETQYNVRGGSVARAEA